MKQLEGIEDQLQVGTLVDFCNTTHATPNVAVSYIERNESGTITAIAFASWLRVYTGRMKFSVNLVPHYRDLSGYFDGNSATVMASVGHWYAMMAKRGANVTVSGDVASTF
jgi:hypothetical protein